MVNFPVVAMPLARWYGAAETFDIPNADAMEGLSCTWLAADECHNNYRHSHYVRTL